MTTRAEAMSRLTFGDDLSETSDRAWAWVTAQTWSGWRADVVRPAATADDLERRPPARTAPNRFGFTSVRTIDTPLAPQVALAAHSGTDLLVAGPGAWSGGRTVALSGAVDGLVRRGDTPIVVARQGGPVRTVLACVDDSAASAAVVDTVLALPLSERAVVTVLTVTGLDGTADTRPEQAVAALAAAGVRGRLWAVEPDDMIATSGPGFRILDVVERTRPDLVALGAPGRSLLARVRAGHPSVAVQVASQSACSVLVAR